MDRHILEGIILVLVTVFIHGTGTLLFIWMMEAYRPFWERHSGIALNTMTLTWVVCSLILLHLLEIAVYAAFYRQMGILPDGETAAYFSLATYTTVGYGDVVLPREWRIFGASEALVGILMTAWSTVLLITVVNATHTRTLEKIRTKLPWKKPDAPTSE